MNVGGKYQFLEDAFPDMLSGIDMLIQKAKIASRFESETLLPQEIEELIKAKNLCELRIVELWDDQAAEEFKALCSTYFDISTQLETEFESEYIIYEYIKIISFGYLGEGWHLVRQFLKTHQTKIDRIQDSDSWNSRLLTVSFKALVGLVRKADWTDINESIKLINRLRSEQQEFENTYLNNIEEEARPFGASELISLYHFAKSIDVVANYLVEGRTADPESKLFFHIGYAKDYAINSSNITLQLLFQFFESFAIKLIRNTIWYNTRGVNSRISKFNEFISRKEDHGVFELLYPQKESLGEIFNPIYNAVVVNLPTSSGKTMIAKYRILMALNQFADSGGWVAYVVPTRALVNQVYNELNKDLSPIKIRVEKISGALELDGFEQSLMEKDSEITTDSQKGAFDVLVTTYEKLHLMIRQQYGTGDSRPLVLAVVDEAHNIEDKTRGLNLEFLLSTIKSDCQMANFLLMTPDISNSSEIAKWLGGDRGKELQLSLHWWQPNERIIGAILSEGEKREYKIKLKTLLTNKYTYRLEDDHDLLLAESSAEDVTFSKLKTKKVFASTLGRKLINIHEPSIILAADPAAAFDIASELSNGETTRFPQDDDVELVRRFIEDELGDSFSLSSCLQNRIGVHSSALPDEVKMLIEDLMSKGKLQTLVATTTIAQGINFPISSVIMSSYQYSSKKGTYPMPVRDFWNLAGRVGRAGQKSLGWVGIISKDEKELVKISEYVKLAADDLQSQLIEIVNVALSNPEIEFERWLFRDERWSGLLQYISHLYVQSKNLETFISSLEQKLIDTLGYNKLNGTQKSYLKTNLRAYAASINPGFAKISDSTGFSTISIGKLFKGLGDAKLKAKDWQKNQLFSTQNKSLQKLIGIMLDTPEISSSISVLSSGETPFDRTAISRMMIDWVNGKSIQFIADQYFKSEKDPRRRLEKCTRAMYSHLANAATWGLAAIQQMPNSGADWNTLSEVEKKQMANLPALLHYGVNTDEAVLMRKNNVPRNIATKVGQLYNASVGGNVFSQSSHQVNGWLTQLENKHWENVKPAGTKMTGADYKKIWQKLNGIE